MEKSENLVKVFIGAEAPALLLKERLEEAGVSALIKNDSWIAFLGASPALVDLYINESELKKAEPMLIEFTARLKE